MNRAVVGAILILIGGFNFVLFLLGVHAIGLAKLTQVERLVGLGTGGLIVLGILLVIMPGRSGKSDRPAAKPNGMKVLALLFLLIGAALGCYRFMAPDEIGPFGVLSVAFVVMSGVLWGFSKLQ